jgi:hypothetical protein
MFYDAFTASKYFERPGPLPGLIGHIFRQYFSPYLVSQTARLGSVTELFHLWLGKQRQEGRRDFSNYQRERKGLQLSPTGLLNCLNLASLDLARIRAHSAKLFLNEHFDAGLAVLPSFVRATDPRFCLLAVRLTATRKYFVLATIFSISFSKPVWISRISLRCSSKGVEGEVPSPPPDFPKFRKAGPAQAGAAV